MQSQDERDEEGFAARKERERDGIVKEFTSEEITGRYEGEELELHRAMRGPAERFGRLENKHDALKNDHDELKKDVKGVREDVKQLGTQFSAVQSTVAAVGGKLEGQQLLLTQTLSYLQRTAAREQATFSAKVDVDRAKELAKVEVDKEQQLDTIDAKKNRREVIAKGIGLFAGGGGLIEILHRLGVL